MPRAGSVRITFHSINIRVFVILVTTFFSFLDDKVTSLNFRWFCIAGYLPQKGILAELDQIHA